MRIIYTVKTRVRNKSSYGTNSSARAQQASDHLSKSAERRAERGASLRRTVVVISLTCHLNVRRAPHFEIPSCGSLVRRNRSTRRLAVACRCTRRFDATMTTTTLWRDAARYEETFALRGRASRTGQPPRSLARPLAITRLRTPRIESHVQ